MFPQILRQSRSLFRPPARGISAPPSHRIELLESRIAPATFDLSPFNGGGPFTLEVDPNNSHIHITSGAAGEIFDDGLAPGNDLFVTGGGAADNFIIALNGTTNVSFTGTLSVNVPGPITVTGSPVTGTDLALTSGSNITYSGHVSLGASAAHFTAGQTISFTSGSTLTTNSGDIVILSNQAAGMNGTFTGIALDGATISTTGTGAIHLTGTGGTTGNGNAGISMFPGSVISSTSNLATAGTIDLLGKGGPGITNNQGVFLTGNGTTFITSQSGAITVTGLGAPLSTGTGNVGVQIGNGAKIVSSGVGANAATITIEGTGGGGTDSNLGFFLDGSGQDPQITSVDGKISITGTALATTTGQGMRGISIEQGAQILVTGGVAGTQSIKLQGTGGGGGDNREGVFINQTSSLVSAAEGFIVITGTGGANGAGNNNNGVRIAASATVSALGSNGVQITGTEGSGNSSEGIFLAGALVSATGTAGVDLGANNLSIDAASTVNGGTAGVFLHQRTDTIPIDLGGPDVPGMALGITNAELNRIVGGQVTIGNTKSGAITVTTPINAAQALSLITPATVSGMSPVTVAPGGSLSINATGGIDLSAPVIADGLTVIAGPQNAITLADAGNKFGTVSVSGGSISLRNDTGFNLLGANVGMLLTLESAGIITQTAPITGAGGLTKLGAGTLNLSGANTYSGDTTINAGTLQLTKPDVIPDGPGKGNVTVNGALDLNGFQETIGAISGLGTIRNVAAALSMLRIGSGDASGTFSGSIQGHLSLEKIGAGVEILNGPDTATDGTKVTAGTLQFNLFGSALNGATELAGGTLFYNLTATLTPNVVISADSTIGVSLFNIVTLPNLVSGAGGLSKTGGGTLILGNQLNSFGPAPLKILGGTLQVATDGALGDPDNDVQINNGTFAAAASFTSARNFSRTGGVATIDAQVPALTLINKAVVPADLTPLVPANLAFAITYADTTPVPLNTITVGNTAVTIAGTGTLTIHKLNPTTIDTIELTGSDTKTKLVINAVDPNMVTTVYRIVIDDPDPSPNHVASIGTLVLGKNVQLGDGVRDSVPDLYIEGQAGKLQLYDLVQYADLRLGDGLLYHIARSKSPDTYNNHPDLSIHKVLGPGVLVDLTPSDLFDVYGRTIGGGGLGKVVVDTWDYSGPVTPNPTGIPGSIRTTQSIGSFTLLNGDCSVVFSVDKDHVGTATTANVGNMTIPNGSWGSSGSEIEGNVGSFNADDFLAGATLTAGSMGKLTLDTAGFAGLLRLTDPDAAGIGTFTIASDFTGSVDSNSPIKKLKIKGDFAGSLRAPFISSITAYSFGTGGSENSITAFDGSLGTLTATAGAVSNLTIVTDQIFKGFNVKLTKLSGVDPVIGIDNVHIQALSIGNISVSLAAAINGPDLIGIRDSDFITTGNGATKGTMGSIGNVTVTLTGASGSGSATAIQDSTFDALVNFHEFGSNAASTVNPLGKISTKVSGADGTSLGLDNVEFAGDSIGTSAISVTPGKGGSATATAIDTAGFTATGAIGALSISGKATNTMVTGLDVSAGSNVGAVTVKSADTSHGLNGTIKDSSILAGQSLSLTGATAKELLAALAKAGLGAVNVSGSLENTDLVAGASIAAVTVGGSMTDSLLLAGACLGADGLLGGAGANADSFQRAAAIAAVTVKGDFARTSIVAGVHPHGGGFGNGDDTVAALAGVLPNTSSIGPITLSVGALAATGGSPIYAIEAARITSLKLGSTLVTNFSNPQRLDLAPVGLDANDVIVRLIA